ncbi:amino acid ABC transporter substrate-binding protein [Lapidilactobacillus bayanensis]|uniref:amino acid ABC transporter substrate-binding protein n=1 Tax=Lapidilactobacillus bayanensis TaxID=2485998 RepID=UPI000F77E4D7|nr:amino acid ABC transporter substrate-binding protein [Lapidilactobacillus bayanensis]
MLKKNWRLYLLSCLLIILLPLVTACSNSIRDLKAVNQKKTTLIAGIDDTFVPMDFQAKNGQIIGFDADLARAAGKKLGQKIVLQSIDWDMKETELRNGTIDLIWNGYTKTKAREKQVAFSQAYLRNRQVLVTLKKSQITSFTAMKNKKIGLQNGSSGQSLFNAQPQVLKNIVAQKSAILYDNFNNAFLDLQAGRIQGVLGDSIYAGYYIRQHHSSEQYRVVTGGFPEETFAVGLRKSDVKLRQRLNQALTELYQDGTIARLSQKWFKEDLSLNPATEK